MMESLHNYLTRSLGPGAATLTAWLEAQGLPRHLYERYDFYTLDLWGKACIVMAEREEGMPTANELQKWLGLVEKHAGVPVVYVPQDITARQRQRLIALFIPFIVPGKQLFLPPLGINLYERYLSMSRRQAQVLSPAAQAVLLGRLQGVWADGAHASELARLFGYSAMTLSRAKRELLDLQALQAEEAPVAGLALRGTPAEVWHALESNWRSPLLRQVWVTLPDSIQHALPLAGLSALAEYTMLNTPAVPVYAIGDMEWAAWRRNDSESAAMDGWDEGRVALEIWRYDPVRLASRSISGALCVDRYSLYLSLRDRSDDRVSIALDEIMEQATA